VSKSYYEKSLLDNIFCSFYAQQRRFSTIWGKKTYGMAILFFEKNCSKTRKKSFTDLPILFFADSDLTHQVW
jgi:hypothetical protein